MSEEDLVIGHDDGVEILPLEDLEEMRSGIEDLHLDTEEKTVNALLAARPPSPPVDPPSPEFAHVTSISTSPRGGVVDSFETSSDKVSSSSPSRRPAPPSSYAAPAGATKMAPTQVRLGDDQGAEMRSRRMTLAVDLDEYRAQLEQNDLQTKKTQQSIKGIRGLVSKKKKRFIDSKYDLDLAYITDRLIAMGFPSEGREGIIRNPMNKVQQFFEERHPNHYKVYNLCSERAYKSTSFRAPVAHFGFDDHNPPTLELLDTICKDVAEWLEFDTRNVAALHCLAQDHEILTNQGFLNMQQVQAALNDPASSVLVAGYDEASKAMVYERPLNFVYNAPRQQMMVEMRHPEANVSLVVTPGHEMYVKRDGKDEYAKVQAKTLLDRESHTVMTGAPLLSVQLNCRTLISGLCASTSSSAPSVVSTMSSACRDELVQLCSMAGYGSSFHQAQDGSWQVAIHQNHLEVDLNPQQNHVKIVPYSGPTWCVTMPSGFIFARRTITNHVGAVTTASTPVLMGNCKAGKGRTGTVICAYLSHRYMEKGVTSQKALDFFAERRTHNKKGVTIASQIRWVHYYYQAKLRGLDFTQSKPMFLSKIVLHGAPNIDGKGGVEAHFVLSSWATELEYHSKTKQAVTRIAGAKEKFTFDVKQMVDKDVKLQFYKHDPKEKKEKLNRIFHVWFNTHFVENNHVTFTVQADEIDGIKKTKKLFPPTFAVEFIFEDQK